MLNTPLKTLLTYFHLQVDYGFIIIQQAVPYLPDELVQRAKRAITFDLSVDVAQLAEDVHSLLLALDCEVKLVRASMHVAHVAQDEGLRGAIVELKSKKGF